MKNYDNKQTTLLKCLKSVEISELMGFDISKLMFNISGEAIRISFFKAITRLIRIVLFDCIYIEFNFSNSKKPLLVTYNYHRYDHSLTWKQFKDIINDYDEIYIDTRKPCISCTRKFNDIVRMISTFASIYGQLECINDLKIKIFLSVHLAELSLLVGELNKNSISNNIACIFFDGNYIENCIVQFLRKRGVVVTLQHGQPVFHGMDCDRINQTMILNFSSDYIIVTGEYSKKQFLLGGISEDHIYVGGSLRQITAFNEKSGNDFTLFLDCPTNPNASIDNSQLIALAESISDKFNSKYIIKCHPQDKFNNYSSYNITNGVFYENDDISGALDNKAFAILHASGVYLDVIANGTKAFCYVNKTNFPLVEEGLDSFKSIDDFFEKKKTWDMYSFDEKRKYLNMKINYYLYPYGAQNRYKCFVNDLLCKKNTFEIHGK